MAPHVSVEGHTGSCGGRGYGGARSDEVLTWTGKRSWGKESAGKARTPVNDDESAIADTAICKKVTPGFPPIGGDRPVNMLVRSTHEWDAIYGRFSDAGANCSLRGRWPNPTLAKV